MGVHLPATRSNEADPVVLTDPATGDLLGTAANPLVVSSAGSGTGDIAVHGVDATGAAPTADPVYVAGLDANGQVRPLKLAADGTVESAVANRAMFWPETTTPLGASASFNGAQRDAGATSPGPVAFAYFNGFFLADQTGTASLQCSDDGSTWSTCATDVLAAATPLILQVPVTARYHRVVLANGGTPQGSVFVRSAYTAA